MRQTLSQALDLPQLRVCSPLPQWVESHTTHLSVSVLAVVGGAEAGPTRCVQQEAIQCAIALAAQWAGPALVDVLLHLPPTESEGAGRAGAAKANRGGPGDAVEPKEHLGLGGGEIVWPLAHSDLLSPTH